MRKDTYKFAGKVFKATRKDQATRQILANTNLHFFMVGDNVNQYHFHSGWHLATHVDTVKEFADRHCLTPQEYADNIQRSYNSMQFHMHREIGRRPLYYVEIV